MENFNLKKFLVESKLTTNSRMIKENTTQEQGGYVEVMGPDFDEAIELLQLAWREWKNGPATEPTDIPQAKQEILNYIGSLL